MTPTRKPIPHLEAALLSPEFADLTVEGILKQAKVDPRNQDTTAALNSLVAYFKSQGNLLLEQFNSRLKSQQGQIHSLDEKSRDLIEQNSAMHGQLTGYKEKEKEDRAHVNHERLAYLELRKLLPDLPTFEVYKQKGIAAIIPVVTDLRTDSLTDHLMGIGNKRLFARELPKYFERLKHGEITDLSLLFADADEFKSHNDRIGHVEADAILGGVGSVAKTTFVPGSLMAKYGGEEVVVVVTEPLDLACRSAERFRTNVKNSRFGVLEESDTPITITLGVATYEHGMTPKDLTKRADQAMHAAKRAGKDRVYFYNPQSKLYTLFHKE